MYCFIFVQFAQLIRIQKKLGKENFPLVEQAYYPNHREMVSNFKYRILYIYHQILLGVLFPVASHSRDLDSYTEYKQYLPLMVYFQFANILELSIPTWPTFWILHLSGQQAMVCFHM